MNFVLESEDKAQKVLWLILSCQTSIARIKVLAFINT